MGLRRKAVYKKTIEFSRLMGRRRPKRLNSSQGLAWLRRLVTFSVYRFLKSFTTLQNTDGKRHTQRLTQRVHGKGLARDGCCISRM
ncbi:hypothetical protein LMH87_004309 [Akanthomyces muscarius]|uniref:Uncharacterized protein n=1 Tax=Akanthomyces muscarius TaxID=2231603 RepID=A0A9W8Q3K6_AKAMU|nr:hypothetical protein LMH87_004309 [Akanthomyces muscarius]KAJ4145459.1 hypothetical protein LMH87_004309 [Akanthomyces muscarius]